MDVTDFPHGTYFLRVHLNPGNQVAESDFRNNVAKCSVYDYGNFVITRKCWIGRIEFKAMLITFKAIYGLAPSYICELINFKESGRYNVKT